MINEIKSECWYVFLVIIIITWGMFLCAAHNYYTAWESTYQNWHYNLNPSEGTGWIDSVVRPEKNP